ncbi:MAG: flagellar basal body L-ring protein FlgH [Parvibaculum sp.]|uniref:flagellar basal body L-ring protein FlgH n=1 Tax=Parvibaculum sp. TaxID=2024848 RepID=UPI00283C2173|nr:flagellar basal body L-ring protein FlgH [Parvibaculum sp.]MDR3500570.1 flagellar basal body L-ring protein FlgH [Parvibaculum sp.]
MYIRRVSGFVAAALLSSTLAGCGAIDRIDNIGAAPALAPIANPTAQPGYQPVSMPMPQPEQVVYEPNSLWRAGSRAFFRDQRASHVGDILTVLINIADSAKVDNSTQRTRANSENAAMPNLLGFESKLKNVLPAAVDPTKLVDATSASSSAGTGTVDRKEAVDLTIAAVVTQVLPNGNLVIQGRQEVRVNFEVRELLIAGIVRPEDISNTNTILHTQIAEARISYGGRGQISDMQQPRYGQQLYDVIMPF